VQVLVQAVVVHQFAEGALALGDLLADLVHVGGEPLDLAIQVVIGNQLAERALPLLDLLGDLVHALESARDRLKAFPQALVHLPGQDLDVARRVVQPHHERVEVGGLRALQETPRRGGLRGGRAEREIQEIGPQQAGQLDGGDRIGLDRGLRLDPEGDLHPRADDPDVSDGAHIHPRQPDRIPHLQAGDRLERRLVLVHPTEERRLSEQLEERDEDQKGNHQEQPDPNLPRR
jgi:hypothetical protein